MNTTGGDNYTQGDYEPANFYIGSVDKRGHGTAMRVPDNVHPQIVAVVNSDATPYRSVQDFFRDAGVHRMHWLRENSDDPELRRAAEGYIAQMEAERIVQMVETVAATVREIPVKVQEMIGMGDMEAARAYLLRMSVYARSLPNQAGTSVTGAISEALRMYVMK